MPETGRFSPCGGKRMSKQSSPMVAASTSSFILSHARSLARMSMDSVLATAPRPRGCSAPFTQTSKGMERAGLVHLADEEREAARRATSIM